MPNALVTSHFMSKLTPLNISIMGGTPAPPAKKQKKSEHTDRFEEDNDRLRRRRVSIAPIATEIQPAPPPQRPGSAETNVPVPLAPRLISRKVGSEMVPLSTKTSEGIAAATQHVVASSSSSSQRDWSVGGICLPAAGPVSTTSSVLHAVKPNRKQFQKMVEAIDPTEMDVTCDFDFWLWLDAQKLFAPFSYKTHDLSVVALQGAYFAYLFHFFLFIHPVLFVGSAAVLL